MDLMNLHDVFLNASLQMRCMEHAPVERDLRAFLISDRTRFERSWLTFLYVLLEAWQASQVAPVRAYVGALVGTAELDAMIAEGTQHGHIGKLREARDYMCHRDRREYWDAGSLAQANNPESNRRLHNAFGVTLLGALRAHERRTDAS
jgi:hypothetical protein